MHHKNKNVNRKDEVLLSGLKLNILRKNDKMSKVHLKIANRE